MNSKVINHQLFISFLQLEHHNSISYLFMPQQLLPYFLCWEICKLLNFGYILCFINNRFCQKQLIYISFGVVNNLNLNWRQPLLFMNMDDI